MHLLSLILFNMEPLLFTPFLRCVVTGQHVVADDFTICPRSNMPAIYTEYIRYIDAETKMMAAEAAKAVSFFISSSSISAFAFFFYSLSPPEFSRPPPSSPDLSLTSIHTVQWRTAHGRAYRHGSRHKLAHHIARAHKVRRRGGCGVHRGIQHGRRARVGKPTKCEVINFRFGRFLR
jgi:hypothetical protein